MLSRAVEYTPSEIITLAPVSPITVRDDPLRPLLFKLGLGDAQSFASFYRETISQIFSTARAVLSRKEDAEEIACDIYVHVWAQHASYDPARGTVMGWLTMMTRSRAIDRLRKRRDIDVDQECLQKMIESLTDPDSTPEQILERFENSSDARAAIAKLTPLRQQLVALAFFAELSHGEIAAAVKLPLGSVKSHLRRSLLALRKALG